MTCPHSSKRIDGIYWLGAPYAVAWTCNVCKTSGGTPWNQATDAEREEARKREREK